MPNHKYCKGARLERLARAALLKQDYTVVRSAGSKGPCDLVAFNAHELRLVQVKAEGAMRPADWRKLARLKAPPGTLRQIWVRGRGDWRVIDVSVGNAVYLANDALDLYQDLECDLQAADSRVERTYLQGCIADQKKAVRRALAYLEQPDQRQYFKTARPEYRAALARMGLKVPRLG
jgi:Holliday junction resolvase